MLETMTIKSNTMGKLRKIHEGKSFSDRIVIITELFQNSYRAEAKNVSIKLIDDLLLFSDDGYGCDNPENILTLDQSNWKTTDEGFGIGLWSWLAIPDVESIEICSGNWKAKMNVKGIFEENNLVAEIEKAKKIRGFEVKIKSKYFLENKEEILQRIESDGKIQPYKVCLNGKEIEQRDIQAEVTGDYVMKFNNKLFEATLAITNNYSNPRLYYEKRDVCSIHSVPYIVGVVEMKKNSLTLQEPDRKNIIWDYKKTMFDYKLEECRKELYKNFIKNASEKIVDEYAYTIANVLDVEDYEKYILVDDIEDVLVDEIRNVDMTSDIETKYKAIKLLRQTINNKNNNSQLSMLEQNNSEDDIEKITKLLNLTNKNESSKWIATDEVFEEYVPIDEITEDLLQSLEEVAIGGILYKRVDIEKELDKFELEDEEIENEILVVNKKKVKKENSLKNIVKKATRKVWVKANEVEEYQELIARAEYYNVKVFIAKNILYENIFKKYSVPYITEVKDGIRKRNFIKNVGLNTKKERYYLELLQPILEYFNLPNNTFLIGNLKMYIETVLDDVVVHREIIENKKENIKIKGITDGENIILDRHALGLQRFNFTGNSTMGVNELKALLATIDTISHELAHLLYNTEDNTKEHFEKERLIKEEIINLYLIF